MAGKIQTSNTERKVHTLENIETPKERLEYLRGEIEAESISYGEVAELQNLVPYIEPGDVLLLQWAGVPEMVNGYPAE